MKPSAPSNQSSTPSPAATKTKVTFQKPTQPPHLGHPPTIGTFTVPTTKSIAGAQSKSSASVNQNQFASSLANQNGDSGHVTSSQPLDPPTSTELPNEKEDKQTGLANTKEKTPMCLINELARFNRVTHQYTLVDEQGPAHKKTFFVKLQIGEREEYSASGASIKKAQHAAAETALENTEFKHPPPKPQQPKGEAIMHTVLDGASITPTVELNALAMKRGEPAIYRNLENRQHMYYPHNYDFRGMYNQRYHCMRPPRMFYVSLKVGAREFIGEGMSRQMARHNAAKKALEILRSLQLPDGREGAVTSVVSSSNGTTAAGHDARGGQPADDDDDSKSEISIVHEIALRHDLPVTFDVVRESGPPHMKSFITQCVVGTNTTEAEGNSKKLSKKRAAQLMLDKLKNLTPPAQVNSPQRPKTKPIANKKKNRNLIKMQKADPTYGVGINPISRLIQIQQAQKKKEPVYSLVAERGLPRRREFVMQVQVDDQLCTGVGPNKKLAKRHAAEAMLQLLGYNKPSPQPSKPAIKSQQGETSLGEKKVTFSDNTEVQSLTIVNGVRQVVPGLIILPDGKRNTYSQLKGNQPQFSGSTMPGTGKSSSPFGGAGGGRPEQKLCEICIQHGIDIKFDEFSGANNSEHLSRLMLGTSPPHTLHGSGSTPEAARDEAAALALKILSDIIKEDSPVSTMTAAGDSH